MSTPALIPTASTQTIAAIGSASRLAATRAEKRWAPKMALLFSPQDTALKRDFFKVFSKQNYCGNYQEYLAEPGFLASLNSENDDPDLSHLRDADFIVLLLSQNLMASCQKADIALEALVHSRVFQNKSTLVIVCDPGAAPGISLPSGVDLRPSDGSAIWDARKTCRFDLLETIVAQLIDRSRLPIPSPSKLSPPLQRVIDESRRLAAETQKVVPPTVFISHSNKNRKELETLLAFLQGLDLVHAIQLWSDNHSLTGDDWKAEIERHVSEAHIFVLLITPEFLASEPIITWELECIKNRVAQYGHLCPVIARECPYDVVLPWIKDVQYRPKDGPVWVGSWGGRSKRVDACLNLIAHEVAHIAPSFAWRTA